MLIQEWELQQLHFLLSRAAVLAILTRLCLSGLWRDVHTQYTLSEWVGEWGHCKQSTQRQNVSFKHVSQSVSRWLTSRASCVAKNLCRAILWQILKSSLLTQLQYGVWAYHRHHHHLNGQNNISLDTQISSLESRKSHRLKMLLLF